MTSFLAKSTHGMKNRSKTLPILIIKEIFAKKRKSKALSTQKEEASSRTSMTDKECIMSM